MTSLIQDIEAQIAGAKTAMIKRNIGVIREIGDGVARVEGLGDVMLNEMLDLGHGVTGLALSLEETEVGVIILGDYTILEEGGEVRAVDDLALGKEGPGWVEVSSPSMPTSGSVVTTGHSKLADGSRILVREAEPAGPEAAKPRAAD